MSGSTRVFAARMAPETEPGLHAMSSSPLSAATTQVRPGRGRSTEATSAAGTVVHQAFRSDGRGGLVRIGPAGQCCSEAGERVGAVREHGRRPAAGRSVTMPWALRSVMPRPAAMSHSRTPGSWAVHSSTRAWLVRKLQPATLQMLPYFLEIYC